MRNWTAYTIGLVFGMILAASTVTYAQPGANSGNYGVLETSIGGVVKDRTGVSGVVGTQESDGSTDPTGLMLRPGVCDPADGTCTAANLYLYGGQDTTTIAVDGADPSVTCADDDDTVTVYICGADGCDSGTVLTEGTEWTATSSVSATCTSLASAVDALSGISAVCSSPSVQISLGSGTGKVQLAESTAACTTVSTGTPGLPVADPIATGTYSKLALGGSSSTDLMLMASTGATPNLRLKSANATSPTSGADGSFIASSFTVPPSASSGNTFIGLGTSSGILYGAGNSGWGASSIGIGGLGYIRTAMFIAPWTNSNVTALGATTSGEVAVATLFAKTRVKRAFIVISTQAAGTATLTVSMGKDGAAYTDYVLAGDAQAAADTVYGDAKDGSETGANLFTTFFVDDLPSWTATTTVNLQFVSTGSNLDQVTGCTGIAIIEYEVLR